MHDEEEGGIVHESIHVKKKDFKQYTRRGKKKSRTRKKERETEEGRIG